MTTGLSVVYLKRYLLVWEIFKPAITELKFGDVPPIAFLELSYTQVDPRSSETSKKNQILVVELTVIEKLSDVQTCPVVGPVIVIVCPNKTLVIRDCPIRNKNIYIKLFLNTWKI